MTMTKAVLFACLAGACGKSDAPPAPKTAPAPAPAAKAVTAASSDVAPEPPAQPATAAPSAAMAGAAYLGVSGTGLVRVEKGKAKTLIEHKYPINDIVVSPKGVVYASAIGGAWSITGDKVTPLPELSSSVYFNQLAAAPDGSLWALDHDTAYRWDGKAWTTTPKATFENELTNDIAVDQAGHVWVATSEYLWRLDGTSWTKVDRKFTGTKTPYFRTVVAGPDGAVYTSCLEGVFVYKDDKWQKLKLSRDSFLSLDEIAVGPEGRIAASGGVVDVAMRTPAGDLRSIVLKKTGANVRQADVMAVDSSGRTWLRTDNGVVILDADGKLAQQWVPGTVPGITGKIDALAVAGSPAMAETKAAARGTVTGKVISKGKPVVGAAVEICTSPAQLVMFEKTPCTGSAVSFQGVTGADGTFKIADVPVGSYGFSVRPKKTWFVSSWGLEECCTTLENGQTYDIGSINLEKLE